MHRIPLLLLLSFGVTPAHVLLAQAPSDDIRINQVGFYPDAPKHAVLVGAEEGSVYVVEAERGDTVYAARLGARRYDELSETYVRPADFSAVRTPGRYRIRMEGGGLSHVFEIKPRVHEAAARAALKGFYFQRASTALPERYAGKWRRAAGHPDDRVLVHPSAAGPGRPAGSTISAPRGWYDAGDYNKYVVNSGITTATLLALYEDFPAYARTIEVDIPERENGVPDLLDEALWNLRWMLAMQDPADGGVYHKLTHASFSGMEVMPEEARAPRYVVQKSTSAALNLAAVAAQAARVYRAHGALLPGLADSCLTAAVAAWRWARRHPDVLYDQAALNERFDPDVATGAYGDRDVDDEFAWAAAELYVTTGADSFYTAVPMLGDDPAPLPSWSRVRTLGYYTLARRAGTLDGAAAADQPAVVRRLVAAADRLVEGAERGAYGTPMGSSPGDYVWGSSAVAANQGIALIQAYRLTSDPVYLRHALANLDYLLGRNATGYSFLTGFGDRTPMHPHHRPSEADDVPEPVPGLLAGGPNPGRQDGCDYPVTTVSGSYVDDACSYASNEIAINWNAPLVYLASALEALQEELTVPAEE